MIVWFRPTRGPKRLERHTSIDHHDRGPAVPGQARTGDFLMLRDFSRKLVPSENASAGAADQYAVLQVAVLQLPPAVIHSPSRTTSHAHIAFLGLAGSTVHGLLR